MSVPFRCPQGLVAWQGGGSLPSVPSSGIRPRPVHGWVLSPHSLSAGRACVTGPGFASAIGHCGGSASCGCRHEALSPARLKRCCVPIWPLGVPGLREGLPWPCGGSWGGTGRGSGWRPASRALARAPSASTGGGVTLGWTVQVWCHTDPASVQVLPGRAVQSQGSGFPDRPLAPGTW